MLDINFLSGISLGPDHAWAIGLGMSENDEDENVDHLLVEWHHENGFDIYQLSEEPVGLTLVPETGDISTLLVMYGNGHVEASRGDTLSIETISRPPQLHTLRDLRTIGEYTFAVGMARQVYRRSKTGVWTPYDEGVRHQSRSFLDVTGFNCIHGLNENDLFAVGFDGEIWRCRNGSWMQMDSPTDVILNVVEVVEKDLAFACGSESTLLRGQGDTWRPIDHKTVTESLIALAFFRGRLYLSDGENVFILEQDESLTVVDFGDGQSHQVGHLHADYEALWAFGPQLMMRTTDGVNWTLAEE